MKRARIPLIIAAILTLLLTCRIGGMRVIGLRYAVVVNNLSSECPNTVVSFDDHRITLDDGRSFLVDGDWDPPLADVLKRGEYRVRVDNPDGMLHVMQSGGFCSFDFPQHDQMLTIPLFKTTLHRYSTTAYAPLKAAPKE